MKVIANKINVKCPVCSNEDFANLSPTKLPEYNLLSKSTDSSVGHGHELKPVKCSKCGHVLFFGDVDNLQII